ncbi:MAG TPA: C40 family peptidase [Methylomirabilota bacterium]|jgi:cell wall-associated NlpC family hydrolase
MAVLPVRHFSCCRVTAMDPVRANAMSRVAGVATVVGIAMAALVMSGCAAKRPASSTPAPPAAPPTRYAATRSQVVDAAMKYVGAPYARGGASPAGFDCSGFVMFVYGRAGLRLPHGADKQYQLGLAVSRDALAPGDIVFFDGLRHSGIYIGDARFIHATKPGDVVKVSRLDEEWYRRRWVGARRLL